MMNALPAAQLIHHLLFASMTMAQADAPPSGDAPAEAEPAGPPPAAEKADDREAMTFRAPGRPQAAAPAESAAHATPRPLTMEEVSNAATQELSIRNIRWRYSLNFFGDVSMGGGSPAAPDHFFGFALGAQDFLIKGELGNNIVASTEFALEPGVGVDVERFHVRWHSESFYVEAGRTHTALGYWNNAYHHGQWLQPTIERPRWVAFEDEGGLLPVHWVGLNVGAKLKMGDTTLNAVASVGNGRGKIVDDVRNAGDYQSRKAFHASLELVGIIWPELRAGVSGVLGQIPAQGMMDRPALPGVAIDETIACAHLAYAGFPLVLIVETYLVQHRASGQKWSTFGGFGLLGYALGRVTPYVEVERFAVQGSSPDPFFIPDPAAPVALDTLKGIVGLRVDLSDWSALKAEYRQTRFNESSTTLYEGVLNWSWGF